MKARLLNDNFFGFQFNATYGSSLDGENRAEVLFRLILLNESESAIVCISLAASAEVANWVSLQSEARRKRAAENFF